MTGKTIFLAILLSVPSIALAGERFHRHEQAKPPISADAYYRQDVDAGCRSRRHADETQVPENLTEQVQETPVEEEKQEAKAELDAGIVTCVLYGVVHLYRRIRG